jgi:uncharacterized protein with HEPN domain
MDKKDTIRIYHMLKASSEILEFVKNKDKEFFTNNRMLILAVIKDIEIIGEAASKISENVKHKFCNIMWNEIIGMRNRLIHVYFDIDIDILWKTVQFDIPDLHKKLIEIKKR